MSALHDFRKARGLTLAAVASKLGGVSVGSLSRIEKGVQWPSADLARRIAAFTNGEVTPNDFLKLTTVDAKVFEHSNTIVQVKIDAKLLAQAKAEGVNLAAEFEQRLRDRISIIESDRWRRENATALSAMADRIASEGVGGEEYRSFG